MIVIAVITVPAIIIITNNADANHLSERKLNITSNEVAEILTTDDKRVL